MTLIDCGIFSAGVFKRVADARLEEPYARLWFSLTVKGSRATVSPAGAVGFVGVVWAGRKGVKARQAGARRRRTKRVLGVFIGYITLWGAL